MNWRLFILIALLGVPSSARDTTYYIPDDFATVEIFLETPDIDSILNGPEDTMWVIVDSYFVEHAGVINANDHFLMDTASRIIITVAEAYRHHGEYDTLTNYTLDINTTADPWVWDDGGPHIIEYMQIYFSNTSNNGMNSSTVSGDGEWAWFRNNLCTGDERWLNFSNNTPKRIWWTNNVFFKFDVRAFEYNTIGTDAYLYNNLFINTPSWFQNDGGASSENFELVNNVIINCAFCFNWEAFGAEIDAGSNYLFVNNVWDDTTTNEDTVDNISGSAGNKHSRTMIMEGGLSDSNFHWASTDTAAVDYGLPITGDPDGGYAFDFEEDARPDSTTTFGTATDTVQDSTQTQSFTNARLNSKASATWSPNLQYTAAIDDIVTSFSGYFAGDGGDNDSVTVGIYDITSGDTTLVDSAQIGVNVERWYISKPMSISLTASNVYVLGIGHKVGGASYGYRLESVGTSSATHTTLDDPWVHSATSNLNNYLYATVVHGAAVNRWDCGPDEFVAAAGGDDFIGAQIVYADPPYFNYKVFASWQDICAYLR